LLLIYYATDIYNNYLSQKKINNAIINYYCCHYNLNELIVEEEGDVI